MVKDLEKIVVVLLSGGLDSCVSATLKAQEKETQVHLLTIDYGQGGRPELLQADKIAAWLAGHYDNVVEHFKLEITGHVGFHKDKTRANSLLEGFVGWRRPTSKYSSLHLPSGYPSTRDEAFALIAAAGAEARLLDYASASRGEVVLSTTRDDVRNFPDIDMRTYTQDLNAVLSRKEVPRRLGKSISIDLPLIGMSKAEIVKLGVKINAPIELTWSCYAGEPQKPCRECDQCYWRMDAFKAAGVIDPMYRIISS
jgi:7-cyano-7-deazaguanine synthase